MRQILLFYGLFVLFCNETQMSCYLSPRCVFFNALNILSTYSKLNSELKGWVGVWGVCG